MAKDKKKQVDKIELANRIAKMAQTAIGVSDTNISSNHAKSFRSYMRKPMPGDEQIKGRSKYVSNEVQTATDWSVASIMRVFDSQREPVSFTAQGRKNPHDGLLAQQMTQVVNFVLRVKNKHVGVLMPLLKNGFMTGLGVAMVQMRSYTEQSPPQLVKGLTDEALVQFHADEQAKKIEILEVGDPYQAPMPPSMPGTPGIPPQMQMLAQVMQPMVRDIKIRRNKKTIELNIENLPPEDFIVSKDAEFNQKTGGIKASLQGHKRVVSRAELIELGHDEELVMSIPKATDDDSELAVERSEITDGDQGTSDVNDEVLVFEIYTKTAIGEKIPRHYRITLAGDLDNEPVLLSYDEVTKYYPYAAFCPYPVPNTLFGQGVADRIGPEQSYISKMMRFVFDNLAAHANPIKIVNPDTTHMDDALNLYPGATIRSTDPTGGISYNQQQFTGANAQGVIDAVAGKLDFATGVGPNMIALNASDLQNSTATGSSLRANASQLFIELICRWFAESTYAFIVKKIIDELQNNPEDAQEFIARLTDGYEPLQVDDWDPDMDVSANIAFGVMNKDFNAGALTNIVMQQQQGLQIGITTPELIRNTMAKYAENAGYTNIEDFYLTPEQIAANAQQAQANAKPPVDPNAGLIEIEKVKAQLKAQADAAERDFEMRKLIVQNDIERDRMAQEKYLAEAEIRAKYGAQVDIARINAEQAATRNDVDIAMAQMDQQNQAMEKLTQINMAQKQQEQAKQAEAMQQMQPQEQAPAQQMPPMPPQA